MCILPHLILFATFELPLSTKRVPPALSTYTSVKILRTALRPSLELALPPSSTIRENNRSIDAEQRCGLGDDTSDRSPEQLRFLFFESEWLITDRYARLVGTCRPDRTLNRYAHKGFKVNVNCQIWNALASSAPELLFRLPFYLGLESKHAPYPQISDKTSTFLRNRQFQCVCIPVNTPKGRLSGNQPRYGTHHSSCMQAKLRPRYPAIRMFERGPSLADIDKTTQGLCYSNVCLESTPSVALGVQGSCKRPRMLEPR
ncbi:hypothetical protein PM082_021508 [Marasmius tenuissimus]|nr:hypothetical protein PM082_021508 [Marasmius tenuissimus]